MLGRLNKRFANYNLNPFQTVRYSGKDKPDSRSMHTGFLTKVNDTFEVIRGGQEVFDISLNERTKKFQSRWMGFNPATRWGLFDWATLGTMRLAHYVAVNAHNATKTPMPVKRVALQRTDGETVFITKRPVLATIGAVMTKAIAYPLWFVAGAINLIGNSVVRPLVSVAATIALLPVIAISHGISQIVRAVKGAQLVKKIDADLVAANKEEASLRTESAMQQQKSSVALLSKALRDNKACVARVNVEKYDDNSADLNKQTHVVDTARRAVVKKNQFVAHMPSAIYAKNAKAFAEINPSAREEEGQRMTPRARTRG